MTVIIAHFAGLFFLLNIYRAYRYYAGASYFQIFWRKVFSGAKLGRGTLLATVLVFLIRVAIGGNWPKFLGGANYYYNIIFFSFGVICVVLTLEACLDCKGYITNLVPKDAPLYMMLLLPIIELFSVLIRPFTLVVRLATNLSAGHIILYMLRYFAMGLPLPSYIMLTILIILELLVSALQVYIFCTLIKLYFMELNV